MPQRLSKYNRPLDERILKNIKKNKAGCWLWQGAIYRHGYAQIKVKRKTGYAHRASYLAFKGGIPKGKFVCHSCDVRHCVNPNHLWLGTRQDNETDKKRKNRHVAGSKNGRAVLSERQVKMARKRYETKRYTIVALAHEYGISDAAMSSLLKRKNWKHVY